MDRQVNVMGIDKTQTAMEILKYFYENLSSNSGITVSELRKKVLRGKGQADKRIWMKSKFGMIVVKSIVDIFLELKLIREVKKVKMKDSEFVSYRVTKKGISVLQELENSPGLKELFFSILYKEIMTASATKKTKAVVVSVA